MGISDLSGLYQEANDLFIEEEYEKALEAYSKLINLGNADSSEYFFKRGLVYLKLNNPSTALVDFTKAIQLGEKFKVKNVSLLRKANFRKGIIYYNLENYVAARKYLIKAQEIGSKEASIDEMLKVCNEKEPVKEEEKVIVVPKPQVKPVAPKSKVQAAPVVSKPKAQAQLPTSTPAPAPKVEEFVIPAKVRHEWYQTDDTVTVSIFIKRAKAENVKVDFLEKEFTLTIKQANGSDFVFSIDPLNESIDTSKSKFLVLSTKIEVILKKTNPGSKWLDLEGSDTQQETKDIKPIYPSSSKNAKNWDQVSKSVEEDKVEGEKALNQVFQNLFRNADDDTRRAMMKSFTESNGTALSTNWGEVSKGKVETSPPDGMEARHWD